MAIRAPLIAIVGSLIERGASCKIAFHLRDEGQLSINFGLVAQCRSIL
jgi:hypothetical protein